MDKFIKFLMEKFNIYVYTASSKQYCEKVIDIIDPKREMITNYFSRKNCIPLSERINIKVLEVI